MTFTRFLAIALPWALTACEPKKQPAPVAPAPVVAKPLAIDELSIGQGIVITFPHKILIDVTNGSNGRKTRKLLLQTENTPVADAVEQLNQTLRLAKFTKLGDFELPGTKINAWSKDGQRFDVTQFGIAISTSSGPQQEWAPSGSLTLEIHSKTD